jgi:hypothetical protein
MVATRRPPDLTEGFAMHKSAFVETLLVVLRDRRTEGGNSFTRTVTL